VEGSLALRSYYTRAGFLQVGRRDFDGPWHSAVLLEKQLASGRHEPHSRRPIRDRSSIADKDRHLQVCRMHALVAAYGSQSSRTV
jgi:hypothetical protein